MRATGVSVCRVRLTRSVGEKSIAVHRRGPCGDDLLGAILRGKREVVSWTTIHIHCERHREKERDFDSFSEAVRRLRSRNRRLRGGKKE